MYKISLDRELFESILNQTCKQIVKNSTKYWKKELLEPKLINDELTYSLKKFDRLKLTNGLGEDKPQIVIECNEVKYSSIHNRFEFILGSIIEQKNIIFEKDYKDDLIKKLQEEKKQLENRVNKDYLTDVYNMKKMYEDLDSFINQNNSNLLSGIFIKIDDFRKINYNHGYDTANRVLQFLSEILKEHSYYINGEVYRYGGEEFVIFAFLPKDEIIKKIDDLKTAVKSKRVYYKNSDIFLTVSIGISFFIDCKNKEEFINKARNSIALY
ncbi:MAG: GGDEF domain-containing protein [Campylobacterota bacterium]